MIVLVHFLIICFLIRIEKTFENDFNQLLESDALSIFRLHGNHNLRWNPTNKATIKAYQSSVLVNKWPRVTMLIIQKYFRDRSRLLFLYFLLRQLLGKSNSILYVYWDLACTTILLLNIYYCLLHPTLFFS